ncbi:class I SAM-dependent methyltransferase [Mycobacterium sp. PSTR-4-N]|nr:class I SAM-dependent methyltransferase [Mycobacterium sp. PSTR-4-N]
MLDIGCGFGGLAKLVGDYVGASEINGVDIDPRVVDEAADKGVSVILQDISRGALPFDDSYFDFTMSLGVWDYLEYFDGVIREISRITRVGGTVLVSLPNLASWNNRLSLLAGYQPRDVEISNEILAGVPYRPYLKAGQRPAGHIHVPTLRAFVDLMEYHGYETVSVLPGRPVVNTVSNKLVWAIDNALSRRPSLARRFYYVGKHVRYTDKPERSPMMPYELLD